jgi:hypothetical protein
VTNHVHLLVETRDVGLGKIVQGIHQSYTQSYNRRYQTVGHVFQGRYKAFVRARDSYLLELVRYIHLNPVRAKLVADPADNRWNSHRAGIGTLAQALRAGRPQRKRRLDGSCDSGSWFDIGVRGLVR